MRRFTTLAFLLLAALLVSLPTLAQDIITTAIGGGPNGIPAIDADLYNPYGVAVDSSGNFYIASFNQNRVFKVTASTGVISVVAGSGSQGYTGDGVVGGAANASLYHPFAVAVDSGLNVYIADQYNCVIRKVTTPIPSPPLPELPDPAAIPATPARELRRKSTIPRASASTAQAIFTLATTTTAWCAKWFCRPTSSRPTPATTLAVTAETAARPPARK